MLHPMQGFPVPSGQGIPQPQSPIVQSLPTSGINVGGVHVQPHQPPQAIIPRARIPKISQADHEASYRDFMIATRNDLAQRYTPVPEVTGPIQWSGLLQDLNQLFFSLGRVNLDDLRSLVAKPPDRKRDYLIKKEQAIIEAWEKDRATGGTSEMLATLSVELGCTPKSITVDRQDFQVWESPEKRKRLFTDNSNWKANNVILEGLKRLAQSLEWSQLTTNVKTCVSFGTINDTSFYRQDQGLIVYLAPNDPSSFISVAAHDILSPSETHSVNPNYAKIRTLVEQYLNDQEKFSLAFDIASALIDQTLKYAEQNLNHKYDEIKMVLNYPLETLNKNYYTQDKQDTSLEIVWEQIATVLNDYPDIAAEVGLSKQQANECREVIKNYLDQPAVTERGVQRQRTTGWELNPSSPDSDSHILGPLARTLWYEIITLYNRLPQELLDQVPLATGLPLNAEPLRLKEARQIDRNALYQNIARNVISNLSFEDASVALKLRQSTADIEQFSTLLAAERQKYEAQHPNLSDKEKKQLDKITRYLATAIDLGLTSYNELQVYSQKMQISGLGIKGKQITMMQSADFGQFYRLFQNPRVKLALPQYDCLQWDLQQDPANQAKKQDLTQFLIQSGYTQQEFDRLNELGTAFLSYDALVIAKQQRIPCFIHRG